MATRFGNSLSPDKSLLGTGNVKSSSRFGGAKGMSTYAGRKKQKKPHEILEDLKDRALEKFDPEKIPPTFMYVSVSGLIQSGTVSTPEIIDS